MSQYEAGLHFSTYGPNKIAQKMIDSLKSINFFDQSICLIKSTIGYSQEMEITKIDNYIH